MCQYGRRFSANFKHVPYKGDGTLILHISFRSPHRLCIFKQHVKRITTKLDILANTRSRYHESWPHSAANEKHLCGLTLSRLVNTGGGLSKKWWVLLYVLLVPCGCSLLPPFVGHAVSSRIMSQNPSLKIPLLTMLHNAPTEPNLHAYNCLFFFS